ncbi:general secretion pathway protein E [Rhizomicrobium palustre]|uniref:General secretion pathway protein E n=1 Tax=Rhizomicrobium palustre TaxID=189966 RepID=A0A846N1G7_9PROT|nr:GspE/PulE family protein [Rhizomicrobium palustre]NIK88970.1 general secretion pathway protein E [Rhizomicrobium palustre]
MTVVRTVPFPTLGELLLAKGLVTGDTLARAQVVQAETAERLDSVLTRLGMISEQVLADAVADALGLVVATAEDYPAEPLLEGQISPRFLREMRALPLREREGVVEVAFVDPLDSYPARALAFKLRRPILSLVAKAGDFDQAFERLYETRALEQGVLGASADDIDLEHLKDLASDAPVVRLVNGIIARAVELGASDIHIEPGEDSLKLRLRVDGALREEPSLPTHVKAAVVSRIKVMSSLDIAERRLPQDGRLHFAVRGHGIDFRVATAPTAHGESVVLRILDRSSLSLDFSSLGFDTEALAAYMKVLKKPHGILLVTGPTGSGKTTTLYASLAALNTPEVKILTVEDPIEYRLSGINQIQVKPQIGLSFAAALRSFLRHDPDVIMVGEIRDIETAQVAVQSALTGHTILSTLHTNDAASAITRLLDMGVEPYLISSVLNGVLGQRLVRRLCPACRRIYLPDADMLGALGLTSKAGTEFFEAVGCGACKGSGFRGRLALMEFLPMSETVSRLVLTRTEAREIARCAEQEGMRTIFADGVAKALQGQTTLGEVLRVTQEFA